MSDSSQINQSINDLDLNTMIKYRNEYFNAKSAILKKYLSVYDMIKLKLYRSNIYENFTSDDFTRKYLRRIETNICFGKGILRIPIEFETIITTIFKKDMKTQGIFRESQSFSYLNTTFDELKCLYDSNSSREAILLRCDRENILVLTNIFSRLFFLYDRPLFPRKFLNIAMKLIKIEDLEEKESCFKAIFCFFPEENRHLFESLASFFKIIAENNSDEKKKQKYSMTLDSIIKCVTPRIFFFKKEIIESEKLVCCINISIFLFSSMEKIVKY